MCCMRIDVRYRTHKPSRRHWMSGTNLIGNASGSPPFSLHLDAVWSIWEEVIESVPSATTLGQHWASNKPVPGRSAPIRSTGGRTLRDPSEGYNSHLYIAPRTGPFRTNSPRAASQHSPLSTAQQPVACTLRGHVARISRSSVPTPRASSLRPRMRPPDWESRK